MLVKQQPQKTNLDTIIKTNMAAMIYLTVLVINAKICEL